MKPKWGRMERVGGKWRQLYVNYNKKIKIKKKELLPCDYFSTILKIKAKMQGSFIIVGFIFLIFISFIFL